MYSFIIMIYCINILFVVLATKTFMVFAFWVK